MKNKLLVTITLIFIFLFSAPFNKTLGKQGERKTGQVLAEWTIMVFLNADNDLEHDGLNDFEEMADVGSNEKINIVVQFDRSPNPPASTPDWSHTLRFLVKKGMKPTVANALEDLGEVDMGSKDSLADFIRWAKQKYPAKRYMLDIGSHGQGWRFRTASKPKLNALELFAIQTFRIEKLKQINEKPAIPTDRVVSSVVRYVSTDETNGSKLWNREIQNAFEILLAGERVDVIGFDACLMSMLETAFAMRNSASVFVGSEETEPGSGWDYTRVLTKLAARPEMGSTDLGKAIVDSYQETYQNADPRTTLSAVDLSKIDALAASVSQLGIVLNNKIDVELENVKTARSKCANYGQAYGLHGIDLGRFIEQLDSVTTDSDIRSKLSVVKNDLLAAVIHKYAGSRRQGDFGSNGLAIYFPISETHYRGDSDGSGYTETNTEYPVEFVEKHRWDNFLHKYLAKVPSYP